MVLLWLLWCSDRDSGQAQVSSHLQDVHLLQDGVAMAVVAGVDAVHKHLVALGVTRDGHLKHTSWGGGGASRPVLF